MNSAKPQLSTTVVRCLLDIGILMHESASMNPLAVRQGLI